MEWKLDDSRPIWMQLEEQLTRRILSGWYEAGEKLPTVRDLAAEAGVNPNTMQKAFTELERSGLVYTQRTNGRYITEDQERISRVREELARECTQSYLSNIRRLGYEREQALALAQKIIEEGTL